MVKKFEKLESLIWGTLDVKRFVNNWEKVENSMLGTFSLKKKETFEPVQLKHGNKNRSKNILQIEKMN